MRKATYEAWVVLTKNGAFSRIRGTPRLRIYGNRATAQYFAGFATIQKVRVTIEPVKAKKKRKVAK